MTTDKSAFRRHALISSSIGSSIEFYGFYIYGAVVSSVFFPGQYHRSDDVAVRGQGTARRPGRRRQHANSTRAALELQRDLRLRLSTSARGHGFSAGGRDKGWAECTSGGPTSCAPNVTIDENGMPGGFYFALSTAFRIGDRIVTSAEPFEVIDNVPNQNPDGSAFDGNIISLDDTLDCFFRRSISNGLIPSHAAGISAAGSRTRTYAMTMQVSATIIIRPSRIVAGPHHVDVDGYAVMPPFPTPC